MSVPAAQWESRARRLADELVVVGKLHSAQWREAVCAVPRHELVPDVFRRDSQDGWQRLDTSTDEGKQEWLNQVYSNTALLTAVADDDAFRSPRSSSSMPGLMTRMLEALDIEEGHRILEIGTGTGYNAALLTHRLGDSHVFSVDIEPDLVTLARHRLARIGYRPTLVAIDGALGLPEHAPFDRILATCAVPSIPWAWVRQTRCGGVILADLKPAPGAGSLIRLTRNDDEAEGRFDPTYAAFMYLRHQPADRMPDRSPHHEPVTEDLEQRSTTLDPRTPWTSLVAWFLASFSLGADISLGYGRPDENWTPTATSIITGDGSSAEVTLADDHGVHQVTETGPRRLWRIIEDAHTLWTALGQPGWDRFGLTVTKNHQYVWLDHPTSQHVWPLATEPGPHSR